jgi:hypothetical protein
MEEKNPKTYDGLSDAEIERAGKIFIGCAAAIAAVIAITIIALLC